jgi:hypothetical protein
VEERFAALGVVLLQEVDFAGLENALVHGKKQCNLAVGRTHDNSSELGRNLAEILSEDTTGG